MNTEMYNIASMESSELHKSMTALVRKVRRTEKKFNASIQEIAERSEHHVAELEQMLLRQDALEEDYRNYLRYKTDKLSKFVFEVDDKQAEATQKKAEWQQIEQRTTDLMPIWVHSLVNIAEIVKATGHNNRLRWRSKTVKQINICVEEIILFLRSFDIKNSSLELSDIPASEESLDASPLPKDLVVSVAMEAQSTLEKMRLHINLVNANEVLKQLQAMKRKVKEVYRRALINANDDVSDGWTAGSVSYQDTHDTTPSPSLLSPTSTLGTGARERGEGSLSAGNSPKTLMHGTRFDDLNTIRSPLASYDATDQQTDVSTLDSAEVLSRQDTYTGSEVSDLVYLAKQKQAGMKAVLPWKQVSETDKRGVIRFATTQQRSSAPSDSARPAVPMAKSSSTLRGDMSIATKAFMELRLAAKDGDFALAWSVFRKYFDPPIPKKKPAQGAEERRASPGKRQGSPGRLAAVAEEEDSAVLSAPPPSEATTTDEMRLDELRRRAKRSNVRSASRVNRSTASMNQGSAISGAPHASMRTNKSRGALPQEPSMISQYTVSQHSPLESRSDSLAMLPTTRGKHVNYRSTNTTILGHPASVVTEQSASPQVLEAWHSASRFELPASFTNSRGNGQKLPTPGKPKVSLEVFHLLMMAFKNSDALDFRNACQVMDALDLYHKALGGEALLPDVTLYNTFMSACIRDSRWRRCVSIMKDMQHIHGLIPNDHSFDILLNCCRHALDPPAIIYETLRHDLKLPTEYVNLARVRHCSCISRYCYTVATVAAGNYVSKQVLRQTVYEAVHPHAISTESLERHVLPGASLASPHLSVASSNLSTADAPRSPAFSVISSIWPHTDKSTLGGLSALSLVTEQSGETSGNTQQDAEVSALSRWSSIDEQNIHETSEASLRGDDLTGEGLSIQSPASSTTRGQWPTMSSYVSKHPIKNLEKSTMQSLPSLTHSSSDHARGDRMWRRITRRMRSALPMTSPTHFSAPGYDTSNHKGFHKQLDRLCDNRSIATLCS